MRLDPVGQRLIVKRLVEFVTKSGIVIPEEVKNRSLVGQVMAVGPEALEMGYKLGDIIFFGKYSGFMLPTDPTYIPNETYEGCVLMNAVDVLCKLSDAGVPEKVAMEVLAS